MHLQFVFGALPALNRGILEGCFQIRNSAATALIQVINAAGADLNGDIVASEGLFPALLELIDQEEWTGKIVEAFSVMMTRSEMENEFADFSEKFSEAGAIERLEELRDEELDDETAELLDRILNRRTGEE
jgi:hypothetical protein